MFAGAAEPAAAPAPAEAPEVRPLQGQGSKTQFLTWTCVLKGPGRMVVQMVL